VSTDRAHGVSVVIPTYQEACLPSTLPRIADSARRLGYPYELVVDDDASPDGTANVAEQVALRSGIPVRVVRRTGVRSLSAAVVDGARAARYPVVCVLDADLSHDPEALADVMRPVVSGEVEVCIGSRYAAGGVVGAWPLGRALISRLGTAVARRLVRTTDPLSGYFACRRELLNGTVLPLRPRGYKILLEVLARAGPTLRTRDVPIRFRDREIGSSKFGLRQALQFAPQCIGLAAGRSFPRLRPTVPAGVAGAPSIEPRLPLPAVRYRGGTSRLQCDTTMKRTLLVCVVVSLPIVPVEAVNVTGTVEGFALASTYLGPWTGTGSVSGPSPKAQATVTVNGDPALSASVAPDGTFSISTTFPAQQIVTVTVELRKLTNPQVVVTHPTGVVPTTTIVQAAGTPFAFTAATGNAFNMGRTEFETAETTAFLATVRAAEYALSFSSAWTPPCVAPLVAVEVNLEPQPLCSECIGGYVNGTVFVFRQCTSPFLIRNSAYSTVLFHEYLHRFTSGSGGTVVNPVDEYLADTFAVYLAGDPIIALDVFGAGTFRGACPRRLPSTGR
jgi:dolichol-phosphate mannosyltransferase